MARERSPDQAHHYVWGEEDMEILPHGEVDDSDGPPPIEPPTTHADQSLTGTARKVSRILNRRPPQRKDAADRLTFPSLPPDEEPDDGL